MTHTVSIDIAAPVQLYDTFHAALLKHTGGQVDGLLAHVAWPTGTGFRLLEVWTSKESRERAGRDVIAQVWATLAPAGSEPPADLPEEHVQELDTRGIVIPSAGIAV
ncbi:hypothetical protein [Actinoplanes sp. NPDC049599]|uniref:hypothetical protein n=1 Tax=Actinoplanes sp. NPDC049599 TaxID=3363903 RepID=UPI003798A0C0